MLYGQNNTITNMFTCFTVLLIINSNRSS